MDGPVPRIHNRIIPAANRLSLRVYAMDDIKPIIISFQCFRPDRDDSFAIS